MTPQSEPQFPSWRPAIKTDKPKEAFHHIDNLPERTRKALKACQFDLLTDCVFRFNRHAERNKFTDEQVAAEFARIKTYADADRFNSMWGNS